MIQRGVVTAAIVLGIGVVTVVPSATPRLDIDFTRAFHTEGEIRFEPFGEVDWEAIARANFDEFDIDDPPREKIRENWWEIGWISTFAYSARLPDEVAEARYYLLAESGVVEVEPVALRGSIQYAANEEASSVSEPEFEGVIVSRPMTDMAIEDAGFVLRASRAVSFQVEEIPLDGSSTPRIERQSASDLVTYGLIDQAGNEWVFGKRRPGQPGIRRAYKLTIEPQMGSYFFVRWEPDEQCVVDCCHYAYSLFRFEIDPRRELDNRYECDI